MQLDTLAARLWKRSVLGGREIDNGTNIFACGGVRSSDSFTFTVVKDTGETTRPRRTAANRISPSCVLRREGPEVTVIHSNEISEYRTSSDLRSGEKLRFL